ncbi:putative carboxypeptidase s precursor [Naematelia encephala]|uniref:Putative carboxypeptidase s n=1 Tax=Naematelia encephala TaxID=71784 RepID=A0A1Y2BM06_9TREE|nr:putative carboxypeptidase s precursor [Naematelia encephala]
MSHGAIHLGSYEESRRSQQRSKWPLAILATLAVGAIVSWPMGFSSILRFREPEISTKDLCAQAAPRMPVGYNTSVILEEKERIIALLQGAVRIRTEVYDEMGPFDEDPHWKGIGEFQAYLEKSFPIVHEKFTKSIHNLSLVYELEGSDSSLKPIFLTAHQDVVPVLESTIPQWIHDPFSGDFDGKYIWGRGAADTKGSLIAILTALEHLFETTDWKPTRGVVLGFGSDEERGGQVGAPAVAKYLLDKYGKDSMSLLIDEGSGMRNVWGRQFALPAVAEKGHYDLAITVETLGGHSSVPPLHTGIGLLSLLIAELEKNPHPATLDESSPVYGFMTCAASYASGMPNGLKKTVLHSASGDEKAWKALPEEIISTGMQSASVGPGQGDPMRAMMSTTQATDLISGGLKVNALPETVRAVVNHRVNVASDHAELESRTIHTLLPVASKLNLTLIDFKGKVVHDGNPTSRVILSEAFGYYTDPAPISPTDSTDEDSAYTVMASTARGMWASRRDVSPDGSIVQLDEEDELIMAPFMSTGNTDTRRYWDLTNNIYRFRYQPMEGSFGAHTINERVTADDLVEFTRWYQAIILTMDQATNVP